MHSIKTLHFLQFVNIVQFSSTLVVSNHSECCLKFVGSLKFYFCDWNTAFVHAFLFVWARLARSIVVIFLGFQSPFGCIFVVFFYIFLLSKGDSWNPIGMKFDPNLVLALRRWSVGYKLVHSLELSSTLLFVASPRLTAEIHSFLPLLQQLSGVHH